MSEQPDKHQKKHAPTGRRLEKARDKGQVARSRELVSALVFIASMVVLHFYGVTVFETLKELMYNNLSFQYGREPLTVLKANGLRSVTLLLPIFISAMVIATVSTFAQGGMVMKPLSLNLNVINLASGISSKFKPKNLQEMLKDMLKFFSGIAIFYVMLKADIVQVPQLMLLDMDTLLKRALEMAAGIIKAGMFWLFILGVIGYLFEKHHFNEELKMTTEEVKEDHKESDGDPKVKAKIRNLQFQMARKRMLQAVPKATVIITNPTHLAIAILYKDKEMQAPKIVAKGADLLAAKIREIAREHGVPIIEDKPIARMLYKYEIDTYIPAELYKAVAKIIAFVYKLKGAA